MCFVGEFPGLCFSESVSLRRDLRESFPGTCFYGVFFARFVQRVFGGCGFVGVSC
jgi:hypothetical protein